MRGDELAMIFQDPMSSLHPFYRVGDQIVEAMRAHRKVNPKEARARSRRHVQARRHPGRRSVASTPIPHQLSGGMRQRVMIAMALINSPDLLIADEPTTALDVTVQAQILELIQDLQTDFGTTVILITHDLGIVADVADEVAVMYGGAHRREGRRRRRSSRTRRCPTRSGCCRRSRAWTSRPATGWCPIPGNPPSPIRLPKGCVFEPRCRYAR